jgi:hypothetical protein
MAKVENGKTIEPEKRRYRLRYFPVQSFAVWMGDEGWKNESFPGFTGNLPHCAIVINGIGNIEAVGPFDIPNDKDIHFITAQPELYAVIEELSENERYVLGYISKEFRPNVEDFVHGDVRELCITPEMFEGNSPTKICIKCRQIYSIDNPKFCIRCGSPDFRKKNIVWRDGYKSENGSVIRIVHGGKYQ